MADEEVTRRLAAIVAADVAGYSRLVSDDEEGTLAALRALRADLIDPKIDEYNGRIANTAGDSLLIEFPSVIEALRCCIDVQRGMATHNADISADRRLEFRIGINVGDVIEQDGDLLGGGVNVAARLEGLAAPGGICVSRAARDQVRDLLDIALEDMGEVEVKNIERPVRVFRVLGEGESPTASTATPSRRLGRYGVGGIAAAVCLVMVGIALIWLEPWQDKVEAASVDRMAFPLPDKPSIAVLPFTHLSDDDTQDYFADGITEDITTDISKVSGIFVVAPHSTRGYKGKDLKVGEIAEELGVRYVLRGSVRRAGGKIRVTAQLIDAIRGAHLWAERYDRDVEDVFAVQSELTERVVKAMAVTLKAREQDRILQKHVTNIEAYEAFLQARSIVEVPLRDNILKGEELFKKTIELDPSFAGGLAGLSFNHSVKARFGFTESREEEVEQALALARRAIEADPEFAWSHIALAGAHLANLEQDEAVDAMRQALAIQPGGYETNLFMSFYLYFAGKSAPAVEHAEIADNLSRVPTYRGLIFLGMAYLQNEQYAESEATWERVIQSFGVVKQEGFHVFRAISQAALDKMDAATATVERILRINPAFQTSKLRILATLKSAEFRERMTTLAAKAGLPE